MKILAIDDDEQIRKLLSLVLSSVGWGIETAHDGESGLKNAIASHPDVVLLDLSMPGIDGAETLLRLREWSSVPVIIISVRDNETDIARLLDAGADDYIVKPFHSDILVSRIRAVHRRAIPDSSSSFSIGPLSIFYDERRVSIGNADVRLTPIEFAILSLLSRHAGKIVTRSHILKEIWGPNGELEEGSLRVHISSLRKKLESDPSDPSLIITEPGIGYRLVTAD